MLLFNCSSNPGLGKRPLLGVVHVLRLELTCRVGASVAAHVREASSASRVSAEPRNGFGATLWVRLHVLNM